MTDPVYGPPDDSQDHQGDEGLSYRLGPDAEEPGIDEEGEVITPLQPSNTSEPTSTVGQIVNYALNEAGVKSPFLKGFINGVTPAFVALGINRAQNVERANDPLAITPVPLGPDVRLVGFELPVADLPLGRKLEFDLDCGVIVHGLGIGAGCKAGLKATLGG